MTGPAPAELFDRLFRAGRAPADPYPLYERLRSHGPIMRVAEGTWLTTAYDLSAHVLKHTAFGTDVEQAGRSRGGAGWREHPALRTLAGMLLTANPPRHARLRGLLGAHFLRLPIDRARESVRKHVTELREHLLEVGEVDFIPEFAEQLPRRVIADFIGIPEADRLRFRDRTLAFNAVFERDLSPGQLADADAAAEEIDAYVRGLVASARTRPRGDLISTLAEVGDARELPVDEVVRLVFQVYNASYQTVLGVLGNGLSALLTHPGQYDALRSDAGLLSGAVAEMLRWDPPVQTTGRHALAPLRVGSAEVSPGELVVTVLAAANRDPRRYPEPHRFDVRRSGPRALSFGFGIHYCLGAALATVQGEEAFGQLTSAGLRIEAVAPPRRHPGSNMRSVESLRIAISEGRS
ncbi:cytochrome P450 [Amycolatopsis sp. SID8362]|uniref:cytochrome P450 n=1 Tax=Amycolatopsis sp. SID8362 TaxID=2690346 RepID=UPI00136E73E7|nr:cytochrome P450 [Amycolatopsis sp. SID8362]NBH07714.1 cytochrome P450 [Amycolatopsis sp. SID8362]NED44410.1 cytochrome P450 [Amycolatopsis sp. SID8362]